MTEAWPWPVRIRVFGTLGIERDGVPVAFSGKSQKRPLELIKALIAAGDGPASAADLAAALWPDAEGDSAATSLRVNLHRARKLLGYDEALVFEDGKLAFNRNMVWSDRWAFDACVVDIASDDATDAPGPPTDASSRLLSLYRGPLLRDDGDAPWLVADRARCRDALLRAIARVGQACEMRLQWSDAIALYERGIEAEPLAEDLYRALMRCHAAVGQVPEALRAYRRCREILSILLGVKPSAATETLLREIHG
jgi:DNA-binding SARP family transcriptional activator